MFPRIIPGLPPARRYFRTIAVLYALNLSGNSHIAEFKKAKEYIDSKEIKTLFQDFRPYDIHHLYSCMFATIGMRLLDKRRWPKWDSYLKKFMLKRQFRDGSWDRNISHQLRPVGSAIVSIMLQVPLGNLRTILPNG
jgi:hypothetical protein